MCDIYCVLVPIVAVSGILPVVNDFFVCFLVPPHLDVDVRIGVVVVVIASFIFPIDFGENFFVVPRFGTYQGIFFVISLELGKGGVVFFDWVLKIILLDKVNDDLRIVFMVL